MPIKTQLRNVVTWNQFDRIRNGNFDQTLTQHCQTDLLGFIEFYEIFPAVSSERPATCSIRLPLSSSCVSSYLSDRTEPNRTKRLLEGWKAGKVERWSPGRPSIMKETCLTLFPRIQDTLSNTKSYLAYLERSMGAVYFSRAPMILADVDGVGVAASASSHLSWK